MAGQVIDGAVALAGDAIVPSARALPVGSTWISSSASEYTVESLCQRVPAPRASEPPRGRGRPAVH
eukprot:5358891-Pyramimonas_sp.AAC.1